jgi:hypothetical protein
MYFQNYSSLSEYFEQTQTSPKNAIAGAWPETGFALPVNEQRPLPAGRELCISDVFLSLHGHEPNANETLASGYLNQLAAIYLALERPEPEYHDWTQLAEESVRALSFSPECTLITNEHTYLAPYVGDRTKPPESMVQLTVLLPLEEYALWSGKAISIAERITDAIPSFFDSKVECLLRWPEGKFAPGPPDVGQSTRYMDSWYLYHALFNLGRLVKLTHSDVLRDLLRRSLDYARRVARRFEYKFPVFFDLDTLAILRAEAREGAGGENDVCGLYANVMIQAHQIFGGERIPRRSERSRKKIARTGV